MGVPPEAAEPCPMSKEMKDAVPLPTLLVSLA
jgi:hypothetical protein